ncbi:MAG TPA: crosslink repair DNA glycosylase YcaQ family protein, partial [Acidimicrobiales bacterium]|nr:crosslink repair DNA glycosylase YcaQ family protein [Acidimicrobiales bacterium]
LIAIAARCMGVATVADLADYFWIRPAAARLRAAELEEAGRLVPVRVEGWRQPAYAVAAPSPRAPRRDHASLLSPFDSLIWNRERTKRLFDFHYRIGIYVPEHLRTHGYYVLPLLVRDDLVARFDLKADRKTGTLRVAGSYLEPGVPLRSVLDPALAELKHLCDWLGLERISVGARGDLAPALARAIA